MGDPQDVSQFWAYLKPFERNRTDASKGPDRTSLGQTCYDNLQRPRAALYRSPYMTNKTHETPLVSPSKLDTAVLQYKIDPCNANRSYLVAEIYGFKELADDGVKLSTVIPEAPQRESITYSQWMHRQVDEAIVIFRCSPTYERILEVLNMLNLFEDGVAKGRVNH